MELNFVYYKSVNKVLQKEVYKDKLVYAIIGTREPNRIEKDITYNLGKRFARKGIANMTGGANGIDYYGTNGCVENGGNVIWVIPTFQEKLLITQPNLEYINQNVGKGLDVVVVEYVQELTLKQQYLNRNQIIIDTAKKVFIPMYFEECMNKNYGVYRQIKNMLNQEKIMKDEKKFIFLHDVIKALANGNTF